jgi:hypothetical protein
MKNQKKIILSKKIEVEIEHYQHKEIHWVYKENIEKFHKIYKEYNSDYKKELKGQNNKRNSL